MMDGTTGSLTYSKFLVPLEVLIDTIHTPSLNFSDPSFFECWHMDHDVVSWTWTWTSRSVTVYYRLEHLRIGSSQLTTLISKFSSFGHNLRISIHSFEELTSVVGFRTL